jgi:serine O-acetyltransferase
MGVLREDARALRRVQHRFAPFVYPNFVAVAGFRLAVALRGAGLPRTARLVAMVNQLLTGADLDPQATIGPGLVLVHTGAVIIGPGVRAGSRLRLFGGTTLGANGGGWPVLGDDVTVWAKASVLGAVTVGDGAQIGAHALVLSDVAAGATAIGVPAV